jgi:hypothetical protein
VCATGLKVVCSMLNVEPCQLHVQMTSARLADAASDTLPSACDGVDQTPQDSRIICMRGWNLQSPLDSDDEVDKSK